ncbi:PREDICTED: uncharacterized protein LOC109153907 isoform X2 [Ipomoea nil]|uniref:uncharacterized protein LOC109153907 isoform X2 n=1 Tax=Ipomoea nil TaxID=35883 RepID=UPI00090137E8|nr:PREDICTED: uncharacterized protein LOC109153907 isoform X2 [Ipomoea nil]
MEDLRKAAKYYLETGSEDYNERARSALGGGESLEDFYVRETKRRIRKCDVCTKLLVGFYFCCTKCELFQGYNYNLCVECFYGGTFQHNHDTFADNHSVMMMLNEQRSEPSCVIEKNNGKGKLNSNSIRDASSSDSKSIRRDSNLKDSSSHSKLTHHHDSSSHSKLTQHDSNLKDSSSPSKSTRQNSSLKGSSSPSKLIRHDSSLKDSSSLSKPTLYGSNLKDSSSHSNSSLKDSSSHSKTTLHNSSLKESSSNSKSTQHDSNLKDSNSTDSNNSKSIISNPNLRELCRSRSICSVSARTIMIDENGIKKLAQIADAHYHAAPDNIRASADKFFWDMVEQQGKRSVTMEAFLKFMKEKSYPEYAYPELFEMVVKDRKQGMILQESRTLYYIVLSGRPFCSWCKTFIPDIYFCCSKCSARSYALCLDCYSNKAYVKHRHYGDDDVFFLDYTVLHNTIKATSRPRESGSSSKAIVKRNPRDDKVVAVLKVGQAILNAGATVLTIASTLGACTIM